MKTATRLMAREAASSAALTTGVPVPTVVVLTRGRAVAFPEFQSYPGVLHGGLSATALDEVMGYASILLAGIWAATATMDLRYRAQVPYDAPLPLVAGLTDTRGRRVRTWSRLYLPSGEVGAEATALLVALPEDLASRARELYGPMA